MKSVSQYKIYCELIITSHFNTPDEISKKIELDATRTFKKGEIFTSNHSETRGNRIINLWAKRSESTITDSEDISPHIEYFRSLLENKIDIISEIKSNNEYEIGFWIWIETDNFGIGLDLSENELLFIYKIANRLHISVLPSL